MARQTPKPNSGAAKKMGGKKHVPAAVKVVKSKRSAPMPRRGGY
jgi:hypothetical protein